MKKAATTLLIGLLLIVNSLYSQSPLPIAGKAPDFIAKNSKGETIQLSKILEKGPVVIVFYRGNWCKHCNRQMQNMEDSLSMIRDLGATLIAITPEDSTNVGISRAKTDASFMVVPDAGHKIMDMYNVSYELGRMMTMGMRVMGINIKQISTSKDRTLPVPATYVIDANGIIRARHFDEDYRNRMSVKNILNALKYTISLASIGRQ